MDDLKDLTNLILYDVFDFGIEELKLSNLVFENLNNIFRN